jgi:hypothetical protein
MTQKIYKDGTDQYIMTRLGSINNTTGAQGILLGASEGYSLSTLIDNIIVVFSEYKTEDESLVPEITWNSTAGMWKINIPSENITRYGTAWLNISGSDDSGISIIPTAIEVEVLSAPDFSNEVIEGTYTRIEIERMIAAVLIGNETRDTGTSTFTGLDGETQRVVASLSPSRRTITTLDGD